MLVRTSRVKSPVRRPKHARLRLELLEDRSLLSATPAVPQLLITTKAGEVQTVLVGDGVSVEDALAVYQSKADVATAELDQQVSIAVVPNDTSFGSLYGLANTGQSGGTSDADIDADEAWDTTTGTMTMSVGIIDSGIDYRHPDLYLNVWLNQGELPSGLVDADSDGIITFRDLNTSSNSGKVSDLNGNGYIDAGDLLADSRFENGSDNDGNGYRDDLIGWDFVSNDNDPLDDNGHGTHVAGTIGATGNNSRGVVGVNWQVSMAGLKFLGSSGSGSISGAVSALNYAVGEGIKITNNSWGGGGYSSAMANAISSARSADHIFVAAAGNSSRNNDTTASYPSNYNYDNVIAVASTDRYDNLSSFSNYGATTVDLAAPGSAIYSTTPNNTYSTFSGTSMATPHVAGAIALIWGYDTSLSYSSVLSRVTNNVDTLSSLSGKVATGGRLNVAKALGASTVDSAGPRVVSAVASGTASASSVRVTFSEAIDASTFTVDDITNFTGPGGASITATGVTPVGTTGKVFDITFASQTAVGSYQFDIGPAVSDSAGNPMDQNNNGTTGETTDTYRVNFSITSTTTTTFTSTTVKSIFDRSWASSSIAVSQDISVSDLNVKVDLNHTWDGDLYLLLVGPGNVQVRLSAYRGGSGDNYSNTVFDDEASTSIVSGAAPFTGTFRPEQALSAYDGTSAKGTWTLWVYDAYYGDTGRINSWSLVVTGTASVTAKAFDSGAGESAPVAEAASFAAAESAAAFVATTGASSVSGTLPSPDIAPSLFLREQGERNDRRDGGDERSLFAEEKGKSQSEFASPEDSMKRHRWVDQIFAGTDEEGEEEAEDEAIASEEE